MKIKKFSYIIAAIVLALTAFITKEDKVGSLEGKLQLTFVDVGQGDSAFLCTADGETWLFDGGDDSQYKTEILPFLTNQGIEQLDYAVVSHYHNDHIGGIFQLLKSGKIKTLVLPDYIPDSNAASGLLKNAEATDTAIMYISAGDSLPTSSKDLKISVLHPQKGGFSDDNENSNSIVLRLEYFDTSVLLTGDLEEDAEKTLLGQYELESDILKIGHHGSSTSTSDAFLAEVDPVYGIISAGAGNRYGHPHYEVLARLDDNDVMLYRTDLDGDITFFLSEQGIESIKTEGKE